VAPPAAYGRKPLEETYAPQIDCEGLAAGAARPIEVNIHQKVQQQHAAVKRLEKQLEGQLGRLLRWKQEVTELESQIGESRALLTQADEEYKQAVEKLRVESKSKLDLEAGVGAPRAATVKLADVLDGKFDIGQLFQIDILEEFESAEYDISETDKEEFGKRVESLRKGVQDMSKQLFEQLSESAKEAREAHDRHKARLGRKRRKDNEGAAAVPAGVAATGGGTEGEPIAASPGAAASAPAASQAAAEENILARVDSVLSGAAPPSREGGAASK